MSTPFDFVKAVGERRDDPVKTGELSIDDYSPFIVNRALSFRSDAVNAVQLLNEQPNISKEGQYVILKSLVTKRRPRSGEFWVKQKTSKDLNTVMEYTGMSREKSEEILSLITLADVENMRTAMTGVIPERLKK